ncbi:uncharacterized protein LOC125501098 [Athalia rosae]|uniref:uncharacterized protein LOC125501098 n=1 Tax=Athalia rosae TaxID=37344 RepID=UPI002033D42C|nr:uncharacterized protein LOC125501098 [Athalia rosae]
MIMPAAASSIYWNSEDSQRSSGDGSEPASHNSSSSSGGRRRYVDPWDLENYAYLRRRQNVVAVRKNSDGRTTATYLPMQGQESVSDTYYWYPMPILRESEQDPASSSMEEFYLRPARQIRQGTNYPLQQPTYEEEARYVTPNPVYVPLSDIEYPEETTLEEEMPKILPRRKGRQIKNMAHHLEECPCPFHGSLQEIELAKVAKSSSTKQLGLNTYGHLRIDYAKSWNSLHRKMKN